MNQIRKQLKKGLLILRIMFCVAFSSCFVFVGASVCGTMCHFRKRLCNTQQCTQETNNIIFVLQLLSWV